MLKARHKAIISEIERNEDFREYEDGAAERVRKAELKKLEELRQAAINGKMPRKRRKRLPQMGASTSSVNLQHKSPQMGDPSASPPELRRSSHGSFCPNFQTVYIVSDDDDNEAEHEEK